MPMYVALILRSWTLPNQISPKYLKTQHSIFQEFNQFRNRPFQFFHSQITDFESAGWRKVGIVFFSFR